MAYVDHISVDGVQYDIRDAEAVSFEQEQTLNDVQQEQARANIGAGSETDVADLKSQIGQITTTTRNMFDDGALLSAGLSVDNDGYYYGAVRAWNTAFSALLPVAGEFEIGKRYTISFDYYFSGVETYTGNALAIKIYYADESSGNLINLSASKTTAFSVSGTSSATKNLDHLAVGVLDGRANNYILHIKNIQVEEGASATDYIPHIVVYDATVGEALRSIELEVNDINAHVDALSDNTVYVEWEQGTYASSGASAGAKQNSTVRVRIKDLIHLIAGTVVYVDAGYMYRLFRYTQDDYTSYVEYYDYSYDSTLHWITGYFVIPTTGFYGIAASDYAGSTVTDAAAVGAHIHVEPFVALNDIKNAVSLGIMPYNLTGLKAYIDTVAGMGGDVVMPLVTDIHGGYPDTYAVINYLANSGIGNYMFEMGDVIKATYPTRAEAVAYLRESFHTMAYTATNTPLIILQGNHDTNPLSGTDTSKNVTQEIFYGLSMARPKNVHQPARKAYGYADIEAAKVRVIYLNTSDIYDATTGAALVTGQYTMLQQGQLDWFAGTALNFEDKDTPTDWSVIIVSHDSLSQVAGSAFSAILTAFMSGTTASGTQTVTVGTYSNVLTYNCDYTSQGGITVICEVNGHHHKDMIRELGSTGIKQVYVACEGPASASYDDDGATVYYTRNRGTTDEHLIETLVLDKANRKVYFKRFGVGADREITY